MGKELILIVDPDSDVCEILRAHFEGHGYEVDSVSRGEDALLVLRKKLASAIVMEVTLPGMDGYDICREVRQTTRTSHIPIIFLTEKGERADQITGFEAGADDYIVKPVGVDEVSLRVKNVLDRATVQVVEFIGPLPGKRIVEEQVRALRDASVPWTYIDLRIENFEPFQKAYGGVAGGELSHTVALIIGEVVNELGTADDFVGQPSLSNFVVITFSGKADQLEKKIIDRFTTESLAHYTAADRQRQVIVLPNGEKCPLMMLMGQSTHQLPIDPP